MFYVADRCERKPLHRNEEGKNPRRVWCRFNEAGQFEGDSEGVFPDILGLRCIANDPDYVLDVRGGDCKSEEVRRRVESIIE